MLPVEDFDAALKNLLDTLSELMYQIQQVVFPFETDLVWFMLL
jgi:hypothetical protein